MVGNVILENVIVSTLPWKQREEDFSLSCCSDKEGREKGSLGGNTGNRKVNTKLRGKRVGFLSQLSLCCYSVSDKSFSLPWKVLSECCFHLALVFTGVGETCVVWKSSVCVMLIFCPPASSFIPYCGELHHGFSTNYGIIFQLMHQTFMN